MEYVRIYNFKTYPNLIQIEILKYQSAISDDSEYEDDDIVLKKYHGKH